MNLIYQLRNLFAPYRGAALPAPASSCGELLSNLDELCARLPEGEALLITGDGGYLCRLEKEELGCVEGLFVYGVQPSVGADGEAGAYAVWQRVLGETQELKIEEALTIKG